VRCSQVKAKAVSKYVDRIVTLAKRGDKHAFNQAVAYVYKRSVVQKAFDLLPTFYRHRHGGYTRVIPPHERGGRVRRRGDSAEMAYLELTPGMVDEDELEELLDESDEDVELEDGELPLDLRKPYLQFCIDMVKGNMPDQNAWDIASRDFRPDLLYRWLRDPRMTDEQRDTFLKKLDTAINTNNPRIPKELQKYRRIRKVDSDSDEEEEDLDPPQYAVNVQSLSATLNQFVLTKQARQAARADEEFDHEDKTEAVADEDFEAEVPEWRDEVDADVDVGSLEVRPRSSWFVCGKLFLSNDVVAVWHVVHWP
jgi:ribosomal protein L17